MTRRSSISVLVFLLVVVFAFGCSRNRHEIVDSAVVDDFQLLKDSGRLTILTLSSSTSYFLYKDEAMGYHYDLAEDFCLQHGLTLDVKIAPNVSLLLDMLHRGEGDLIAYPVPYLNELKDSISYCGTELISHQVLVQRANKGDTILSDVSQLIGKTVYTIAGSKYQQRLNNYNDEIGGGITIKTIEQDSVTTEDLIEKVAQGEISYTITDNYIARLNKTYYNNINISLPISFDQRSFWAVRKGSPSLAKALDEWAQAKTNAPVFKGAMKKYFELSKRPFSGNYEIPAGVPRGHISPYDELFRKHAEGKNYTWQMLAAISYHESRFINNLRSWAGAAGIMGLMPRTAKIYGITSEERMNPDLSIGAATRLLAKLEDIYTDVTDPTERMLFVLAAYNGGNGHIDDARRLAQKYGGNPQTWESVQEFVLMKRNPEYYNDPVCRSGYFRGSETIAYVRNVLKTAQQFEQHK